MKVGIKLWSSNSQEYFDDAGFADFIEIMPESIESMDNISRKDYEWVVHVPHESFGFDPVNDLEKSRRLLNLATSSAKKLGAKTMVMHPGYFRGKPSSEEIKKIVTNIAKLVDGNDFGKILIENMVPIPVCAQDKGKTFFGCNYDELKQVLEQSGAGLCIDLEHAAITARVIGQEFQGYVESLMKLKPEYFHISGAQLSKIKTKKVHHLGLLDGDIDIETAKKILQKAGKPVCLETPIDIERRKKEVLFLKQ